MTNDTLKFEMNTRLLNKKIFSPSTMDVKSVLYRYGHQFLRNVFFKKNLQFLIFAVTSHCNCFCSTCFYWKNLNQHDELSLDEIKKISKSIGEFYTLLISGGEPFLRADLFEICRLFIEQNKIAILSIPTNCTLPDRIIEFSCRILKEYPRIKLSINPSLDGFKETHDKIRGLDGIFDKATETLERLSKLKKDHGNLVVAVNTVITRQNFEELESFMNYVYETFQVGYHDFELLRGDHKDPSLSLPSKEELRDFHQKILCNRERYFERAKSGFLENLVVTGLLALTQNIKEDFLAKKIVPFDCTAGKNIGVIDANGDVKLCELLPAVGNLKKVNYEFTSVWNSEEANKLRKWIREQKCHCTHVCFINLTVSKYLKSIFYVIFHYMSYKLKNGKN
jgi:MoaA/NifB/PqqE/SkfB family radical SAM enzyme